MEKYRKKYRVLLEFNNEDEFHKLKDKNNTIDTSSSIVYCKNGYITISRYNKSQLRIDIWDSTWNKIKEVLDKIGVNIIRGEALDGEGYFIIEEDDKLMNKVFRLCKAKRQRKTPVGLKNKKDNISFWKRHCKRIKGD